MINNINWMLLVVVCACLGATAQVCFKQAINPIHIVKLGMGFMLYGVASVLYLASLRHLELSVAYPLIAFSYIFTMFFAWILLKESIGIWQWVGTLGIILSVWMIVK